MDEADFNLLSKQIHQHNVSVGWWEGEQSNKETKLVLVLTEIAEAVEGERKNLMDDKLPHRKMAEVELADTLIRWLDLGGRYNLKYEITRVIPVIGDAYKKYFILARVASEMDSMLEIQKEDGLYGANYWYSKFIDLLLYSADELGYDVISALYEKIEFNKIRPDHKLENRMKENGKKV